MEEAQLSMLRRAGVPEDGLLTVQGNIAHTYQLLERLEDALLLKRHIYSRRLRLYGEEHESTLHDAGNYAASLAKLQRFEEAKSLLRKTIPVARRVLGESDHLTLSMRSVYASALYRDDAATLNDLRDQNLRLLR